MKKIKPGSLLRAKRDWWPKSTGRFVFVVSRDRSAVGGPENGATIHWPDGTRNFCYDSDVGDVGRDNFFELILEPK